MVYLYVLTIRGCDWQEKINLAIMDRIPSDEEKKSVIREYWSKYESGAYKDVDEFIEYLSNSPKQMVEPVRTGIWVERAGLLARPERLAELFEADRKSQEQSVVNSQDISR